MPGPGQNFEPRHGNMLHWYFATMVMQYDDMFVQWIHIVLWNQVNYRPMAS